jgi:hypothetical protein
MIFSVDLDTSPLERGETRPMTVYASTPVHIEILCYFENPRPPGYRPCGSIQANSGQQVTIQPGSDDVFSNGGGIKVIVIDATGDRKEFSIPTIISSATPQALA